MLSTSLCLAFVLATVAPNPQPRDSADERSSVSAPPSSPDMTIAGRPAMAGRTDQATGGHPTLSNATELAPCHAWTLDLTAAIDAINEDPNNTSGLSELLDKAPIFTDKLGDDAAPSFDLPPWLRDQTDRTISLDELAPPRAQL